MARGVEGCGDLGAISVECASLRPQTLRANSITATCMPRQMPRYGMRFSRAYWIAWILPSMPRSPKPPGTRIASTPSSKPVPCFSTSVASTNWILTRVRVRTPAWISASVSEI